MDTSAAAAQRVAALDDADPRLSFNAVARGQRWDKASERANRAAFRAAQTQRWEGMRVARELWAGLPTASQHLQRTAVGLSEFDVQYAEPWVLQAGPFHVYAPAGRQEVTTLEGVGFTTRVDDCSYADILEEYRQYQTGWRSQRPAPLLLASPVALGFDTLRVAESPTLLLNRMADTSVPGAALVGAFSPLSRSPEVEPAVVSYMLDQPDIRRAGSRAHTGYCAEVLLHMPLAPAPLLC